MDFITILVNPLNSILNNLSYNRILCLTVSFNKRQILQIIRTLVKN
jgi:hypothetical protein